MSSYRFSSPIKISETELNSGAIHVHPQGLDFGLGSVGWDADVLYGLHGTQSKLWGLSSAFQASAEKPGVFIAVDWQLDVNGEPMDVAQRQIHQLAWVKSDSFKLALTNLLDGLSTILVIKNIKAARARALSPVWYAASLEAYGQQEFDRIESEADVDWDNISEFCTAYPLAASVLLKTIPGLACVVFPRSFAGKEYWFGCVLRNNVGILDPVLARGHSQVKVNLI